MQLPCEYTHCVSGSGEKDRVCAGKMKWAIIVKPRLWCLFPASLGDGLMGGWFGVGGVLDGSGELVFGVGVISGIECDELTFWWCDGVTERERTMPWRIWPGGVSRSHLFIGDKKCDCF